MKPTPRQPRPPWSPRQPWPCWRRHAAAARHPPVPAAHRCGRRRRTSQSASPSPTACARAECRTSLTPPHRTGPKKAAQQLGVSDSQLQAAQNACQHLLPNSGGSGGSLARQPGRRLPTSLVEPAAAAHGSPSACAPTGCRTGPTPAYPRTPAGRSTCMPAGSAAPGAQAGLVNSPRARPSPAARSAVEDVAGWFDRGVDQEQRFGRPGGRDAGGDPVGGSEGIAAAAAGWVATGLVSGC